MKKLLLTLALVICSTVCFSQTQKKKPKWLSDKGYWMIESNTKTPKSSTIYFFTNDNVLIYQEKITGMKIKTNRQKTLFRLKGALEQAYTAWQTGTKTNTNEPLIATAFKK